MLPLHGRLFFFLFHGCCGCGCGAVGDVGQVGRWIGCIGWTRGGGGGAGLAPTETATTTATVFRVGSWLAGATSVLSWLSTRAGLSLRKRHT